MPLTEVDFPNCKINVDNITASQIDMNDNTFAVSLNAPTGISITESSNAYNSTLNSNSLIIQRPNTGSGENTFSLIQPNDIANVYYTDETNSTQCVISSLGIINSGVVNGEYFADTSHYSRNDMLLTATIDEVVNQLTATGDRIGLNNSTDLLEITANNLLINSVGGASGQTLQIDSSNKLKWGTTYPQVVVINLLVDYTITDVDNPVYSLWAKTSAVGQQTIFLPTSSMTIGQTIIIRSEADSTAINSGTGNLIYRATTPAQSVVISQASCVQFCLGSIVGSVYNWFVVSTS